MKAMILCAGLGTRLRPYTETLAKPAIPFLNIPLLGYSLYHLETLGLSGLVANTHHLPETVENALKDATKGASYPVHFSLEAPKILSSGGGIWRAREWLIDGNDFVISNGDEVIFFQKSNGFKRLLEHHKNSGALCTMLTTKHQDVGTRLNGIRTDSNGNVQALSVKEIGADHFTGVFVFSPRIWSFLESAFKRSGDEFHIFKDVLSPAIEAGEKIMAFREPNLLWLETSDPESYAVSSRSALEWFASGKSYGEEIRMVFNRYEKEYSPQDSNKRIWGGAGSQFNGKLTDDSGLVLIDSDLNVGNEVTVKSLGVFGKTLQVIDGQLRLLANKNSLA